MAHPADCRWELREEKYLDLEIAGVPYAKMQIFDAPNASNVVGVAVVNACVRAHKIHIGFHSQMKFFSKNYFQTLKCNKQLTKGLVSKSC